MAIQFVNRFATTLTSAITDSDTTIPVTDTSKLPDLSGVNDYTHLTIIGVGGINEIVRVESVSGNNLTVVRAQEGTTAVAQASGSRIEMRITAGFLEAVRKETGISTFVAATGVLSGVVTTLDTVNFAANVKAVKWFIAVSDEDNNYHAAIDVNAVFTNTLIEYSESNVVGSNLIPFQVSVSESSGAGDLKITHTHTAPVDVRITRTIIKS